MSGMSLIPPQLRDAASRAAAVAAEHAAEVDAHARFPHEAISLLKDEGLLSCWLPEPLGGREAVDLPAVAEVTRTLGRACAATSMIFAMHQSQIACLRRHAHTPALTQAAARIGLTGGLLASATTEVGIGGDVRRSTCAIEVVPGDSTFTLSKRAPVISYGEYADAILVTARRHPDAAPSDQVLVLCERDDVSLEQTSTWNTLGLRGTCSPGFLLTAAASTDHIFPTPYDEISAATMLPVAHVLWSACWLGIAENAANVARRVVRRQARKSPGRIPPAALRLAELDVDLTTFTARVQHAAQAYASESENAGQSVGDAIDANLLKVYSSQAVRDIVSKALLIVGIAGYSLDSSDSLGRPLRDAHGAALMVNNDRILGNTSDYEVVYRGGST